MGSKTKCHDCGTSVNVHPWGVRLAGGSYAYTWRCGPCQYVHEHPDAKRLPRTVPKVGVQPSLDDALRESQDAV
jgi:hypothetical protein